MTNDTRITREMVSQQNLVDRYLLGQMSEREAMAFEDFYASDPETLAELETTSQMIDGLRDAQRRGDIEVSATAAPRDNVVSLTSRLKRFVATPAYGMAASLAAVIAMTMSFSGSVLTARDGGGSTMTAAINIPIVTLAPTRGGDGGVQIDAGEADHIVFALDLGIAEAASYSAVVETTDGDSVWQAEGLTPDSLQSVTLAVPKRMLPAGDYRFVVRAQTGSAASIRFPFAILRD